MKAIRLNIIKVVLMLGLFVLMLLQLLRWMEDWFWHSHTRSVLICLRTIKTDLLYCSWLTAWFCKRDHAWFFCPDCSYSYLNYSLPSYCDSRSQTCGDRWRVSFVQLTVYDVLGKEVTKLVNEELKTGSYSVNLDGSDFSSGVYFYKL